MKRHDQEKTPPRMDEANVTSALAFDLPACALQHPDEVSARDDREPVGHAESGKVRRMMPLSSERPCSCSPST